MMDDLISRQDAIIEMRNIYDEVWGYDIPSPTVPEYVEHHKQIQKLMQYIREKIADIEALPSAEPEQKTGKWIPHEDGKFVGVRYMHYECSECRALESAQTRYCPNCGARMEDER